MFKTLRNAWKLPDIRNKLLFTLLIIVLYRLGASIPVPYVDPQQMTNFTEVFGGTVLQYLNILSGNAFGKATLFALGVSPYITASIVMQLLTIAIPPLERLSKDGENGKKKITAITRMVTVGLALITSIGYAMIIKDWLVWSPDATTNVWINIFRYAIIVACYCAGAALVMWLAEKINDHGIGNGISMILFANIVAGAPAIIQSVIETARHSNFFGSASRDTADLVLGIILAVFVVLMFLAMLVLIVWMSDAERRIPIQYAKRVVGRKMYGGQNTNLPLKVNMSGVMPIIFANSIVAIPATLQQLFARSENGIFAKFINGSWGFISKVGDVPEKLEAFFAGFEGNALAQFASKIFGFMDAKIPDAKLANFVQSFVRFDHLGWIYLIVFLALLIAFAYFYVAISFNPVEVANNIKNNGGAIPGIRSGRPTIEFIKKILNRITLVGALLVAVIAVLPMALNILVTYFDMSNIGFMQLAFSGSSIMIVVGVALETIRELEAQMSLRNYKGFLD